MALSGLTILNNSMTTWPTYDGAARITAANNSDDDDAEYRVVQLAERRFAIAVYDEEREFVFYL